MIDPSLAFTFALAPIATCWQTMDGSLASQVQVAQGLEIYV